MFSRLGRLLHRLLARARITVAELGIKTNPHPPQTNAFSLPPEIVSLILSHLAPESIVAFALSCRSFHQYLPSPPRLSEEAWLTLLNWLEQDIPHLFLCSRCNALHTWRRVRHDYRPLTHYDACCRNREAHRDLCPPYNLYYDIDFPLARVVMNRHLYGARHGPALKTLNLTATTDSVSSPVASSIKLRQSWTARIISDELYLKASVQLYHTQGRARPLRQHLDDAHSKTRSLVCHHVGVPGKLPFLLGECPVRELDRDDPGSPDVFVPRRRHAPVLPLLLYRLPRRCPVASPGGGGGGGGGGRGRRPKGWVVSVTRWHRLGACRLPRDGVWENYAESYVRNISAPRMDTCGAGMVCRSWRAVDAESTEFDEVEDGQLVKAHFAAPS